MHWVQFGNDHAREAYRTVDGDLKHRAVEGRQITAVVLPDGWGLQEMYRTATEAASEHFDADPLTDDKHPPAWIESSSPTLLTLLAEHYGLSDPSRPAGWRGDHPSVEAIRARSQDAR